MVLAMETIQTDDLCVGNRSEPRTNMFVMASMSAICGSGPVRIRNLSSNGGLIEGDFLPEVDEALQLRRGTLSASGRVVWKSGKKAGLRLDRPIVVSAWLPSEHAGQKIVDHTFRQMKAGSIGADLQQCPAHPTSCDQIQLRRTAHDLDALADSLAEDAEIVARFASKLQVLDAASQLLRKLAHANSAVSI
jgi:hypothetical protein